MKIIIANLLPQTGSDAVCKDFTKRMATLHFPTGLGIIAAVLKKSARDFDVYDSYVGGTLEGFLNVTKKDKPDILLLSGFLGNYNYSFIKSLSEKVKNISSSTRIIVGGPIASTIPELLIFNTKIDFVVKGEGEMTIVELLGSIENNKDASSVKGIYYRGQSGKVIFTGERERIGDLNESPFPYYESFPMRPYVDYLNRSGRCWEISTSRGCYGSCYFCKLTFGQKITQYSCQTVADHMVYIYQKYGINRFSFVDDNFLNEPARANEFVRILKSLPYAFKWRFQGRADRISPEMAEKMADVGLFDISFGIESGSSKMLTMYNKRLDINKVFNNLTSVKNVVNIRATFIVGGPGENWDTIKETENFINKIGLKNGYVGILTLFPGTVLYDMARKDGLIEDEERYCMELGPTYEKLYTNISMLSDSELLKARETLSNALSGA